MWLNVKFVESTNMSREPLIANVMEWRPAIVGHNYGRTMKVVPPVWTIGTMVEG